jgi:hypothetical protein
VQSEQKTEQVQHETEQQCDAPVEDRKYANEYVEKIYTEYVRPHVAKPEVLGAIDCLLRRLDAASDTPSVSFMDGEREGADDSYDVLRQVTLAEHTLHVVSEMHSLVKETFPDSWKISWPSAAIVAIGHDLGKAGVQQQGYTVYGEHQVQSAEIVFECTKDLQTRKLLSDVVRFHHGNTPDHLRDERLLDLLKRADSLARKKEMAEKLGSMGSWKDVDVKELCTLLAGQIEKEIKEGDPKRFSVFVDLERGLLFIVPALFVSTLREYTKQKNIFWPEIASRDEKEVARGCSELIRGRLSPAGLIPSGEFSPPGDGFYRFRRVELSGRPKGTRPFVILMLAGFCKYAGRTPSELTALFRTSHFSKITVS